MSGCLPMLVQLPIIFALYNIIRNPLTYISRLAPEVIDNIKTYIISNSGNFTEFIKALTPETKIQNIQQIDIIKIFNTEWFEVIRANVEGLADFKNIDFGFFGQMLTSSPAEAGLSILLLIPFLNFAASFLITRLTKKINASTMSADVANNKSMKFMEYGMPLLIVYMSYTWYAALGLYWIFQSILDSVRMLILSKVYPIPKISEEEYELARKQNGTVSKKKKKKPAVIESEEAETEEDDDSEETYKIGTGLPDIKSLGNSEIKDEKYISKTVPKGINPNVKTNYQKTGKKYKINKRKK